MGQYWLPVNLDKKEYINPHHLGAGLKLWEQLAAHPGTAGALIVLTAAMPERRGGGDFDLDENWHGPERTFPEYGGGPGPMPEDYPEVAARTIGRWAGDRIALVGDYARDEDLAPEDQASRIWSLCTPLKDYRRNPEHYEAEGIHEEDLWTDVTADVARVIEHELRGKFVGQGWKDFERSER